MDIHAYIQSGIIESYLLGIAGEEEINELNMMRRQYPEVESAIHSAEEWLHGIATPYSTPVPAKVKGKIFASINEDTIPTTPVVKINTVRPVYKYLAVASSILLITSVAANLLLYNKYITERDNALALQDKQQVLLTENKVIQAKMNNIGDDLKMITASNSSKIVMDAVAGRTHMQSVLMMDAAKKQLLMVSNSLPDAPSGMQYQLWAIVKGKPVSAGLISVCDPYCKFRPVAGAEAYAVTLEHSGGSENPTLDQMFVFGKVSI